MELVAGVEGIPMPGPIASLEHSQVPAGASRGLTERWSELGMSKDWGGCVTRLGLLASLESTPETSLFFLMSYVSRLILAGFAPSIIWLAWTVKAADKG